MKVSVQARGPWVNHLRVYADPNALLPILAVSSKSKDKERGPTSHKATKTPATIDGFSPINILTQDPLAPPSAASTLTVFATNLLTLLTASISTTAAVATASSEQSTFISHPSTDSTAQTITRPPTPTLVPTSAPSSGSGFSVLSIALISAGGALLVFLISSLLRRCCTASRKRAQLEDISKETPLFGGTGFGEVFDQWPTIRSSGAQVLAHIPPAFVTKSRFLVSKRATSLDGAVNGWNVLGDYEEGKFLHVLPGYSAYETVAAGNHQSGLAGVDTPSMNRPRKAPPPSLSVTRTVRTICPVATTLNGEDGRSQRASSFPTLELRNQSARSISPESACDAKLHIPSQSKVYSPIIPNIFAPFAVQPLADHVSFHTRGRTKPLALMKSNIPVNSPYPCQSNSHTTENNLPKQHVQSIPHLHPGSSRGQQVLEGPKKLPWKDSRTSAGSAQGSIYMVGRGLAPAPKFLAHKSQYILSSGRPVAPAASSDLHVTGFKIASDFPLPPVSNTSTLTSYTSLPYALSPHTQSKHDPAATTILPILNSPSLLPYVTPESPSLGLANVGDLMLNGFDQVAGADGRDANPDLRKELDSENKTQLESGNRVPITLGIVAHNIFDRPKKKFNPVIEHAPSIMVETTPIPHNPKDFDRRLSRTAAQTPVKTSASRNSDPEASASGTLYDPGHASLAYRPRGGPNGRP